MDKGEYSAEIITEGEIHLGEIWGELWGRFNYKLTSILSRKRYRSNLFFSPKIGEWIISRVLAYPNLSKRK